MPVSFDITADERRLVQKIVDRVQREGELCTPDFSQLHLTMDLVATHANGCPLDFEKLYAFDSLNFAHDIAGIGRHLDRTNGRLADCFVPRCAKRNKEKTCGTAR